MPQVQILDLTPSPRNEATALERTIAGFSKRNRENQIEESDADQLSKIYKEHLQDGQNIQGAIQDIQTNTSLSPSKKVAEIKRLTEFEQYNQELQRKTKADADRAARQPKVNQADRPMDPDQIARINKVEETDAFKDASVPEKQKMLRNAGVSKENIDSVTKAFQEEAKPDLKRQEVLAAEQAKADIAFAQEQADESQEIFKQAQTLDEAEALNNDGVTGNNWDIAMQKAGLLQYTSDGYRVFSSLAKDAVKNQNIKATIGSQISQMEFGFFRDATINPNFRKEANDLIIKKEKLALRYKKLYNDISKKILQDNNGEIPIRFKDKVNEEFAKQSEKISKEVRQTARDYEAIQNVPEGKVLMFDDKRRPLHVPANEVEKYTKLGASLS